MSSISLFSRAFVGFIALSVAPACFEARGGGSELGSGRAPIIEQEEDHDPGCGGGNEPSEACASFEGAGCYWMENTSGDYCWVPADWAPTVEDCFAMDSCDGGLGASGGGCYKWADGSGEDRYPWPEAPAQEPACASFEGTGCYWMDSTSGDYCWVPADWAPTVEDCFAMDSCDGGLGASDGGCYKWADGSGEDRYPW
ncbi:hypothetical protein [Sorangium sp. So ce1099]|uniref:hypothetical protein n=1 Tax=Sorangium sp. So ce1099 TaxID=3133331 RepID=UPI003F614971